MCGLEHTQPSRRDAAHACSACKGRADVDFSWSVPPGASQLRFAMRAGRVHGPLHSAYGRIVRGAACFVTCLDFCFDVAAAMRMLLGTAALPELSSCQHGAVHSNNAAPVGHTHKCCK